MILSYFNFDEVFQIKFEFYLICYFELIKFLEIIYQNSTLSNVTRDLSG